MPIHDWTRVLAGTWHAFHLSWISSLQETLNQKLPKGYYALAEQVTRPYVPDVLALQSDDEEDLPDGGFAEGGGTGLAVAQPKTRYSFAIDESEYDDVQRHIAIRHASDDRLIALIEIVSPGNKSSGTAIRDFVEKARDCLHEGLHLLIIDLFPPTPRDPGGLHPLIWESRQPSYAATPEEPLLLMSYLAGSPRQAFIEPAAVGSTLIDMPLFFTPQRYINVPLEETYQAAYRGVPQKWKRVLEAV